MAEYLSTDPNAGIDVPPRYLSTDPNAGNPIEVKADKKSGPSDTRVALNAVSKGIAAIPDSLLNAPQNLVNLGRAGFGTVATAMGRPDLAPGITPAPNFINRILTKVGSIGEGGEPQNTRQRIIDAIGHAAGGMMVNPARSGADLARNIALGASGGLASGATKEATGSDAAAMLAGMATPAAANAAGNRSRQLVEQAAIRRGENSVNDQTLSDARRLGFVVAPSEVRPGVVNNTLESIAGKAALRQEASLKNQDATNRAMVQELGLRPGTAVTSQVIRDFVHRESKPYREISALSPQAANTFERLRNTREQMQEAWREANGPNHPRAALADARALTQQAEALERSLEQQATQLGRAELVPQMREARIRMAKAFDIDRARNVGDADISARMLGRNLDRNENRVTGNLRTVGAFAEGPGNKFTQDGSAVGNPGTSAVNAMASLALGAAGHNVAGLPGMAAAAIPFARGGLRSLLLSRPYQALMASPNHGAGIAANAGARISAETPQQRMIEALLIAQSQAQRGEQ